MNATTLPRSMAWRIFVKDFRLLWPLALASGALQLLLALMRYQPGSLTGGHDVGALSAFVTLALIVGMCLLILLAVQQESIPGVTQDWLVRPIKRRDLLLAKVLMVVLLIHGPIIVGNFLRGVAEGFDVGAVLSATLKSNIEIALVFSLPIMAVAAITRRVAEALVGAILAFLGLLLLRLLVLVLLYPFTRQLEFQSPTADTGIAWVWIMLSHALLLLTMLSILVLQYYRRCTLASRTLFIVGLFVVMLVPELPWRPAFALQQWLGGHDSVTQSVVVGFDPSLPRQNPASEPENEEKKSSRHKEQVAVLLPLQVSKVPQGFSLHTDRADVRLIGPDGGTLYHGVAHLDAQNWLHQEIEIPSTLYSKLADQTLRMEADYSLTLLKARALPTLAAPDGKRVLEGIGQCASRLRPEGDAVEVSCRAIGDLPPCLSLVLEQTDGTRRGREQFVCDENYEPYFWHFSVESINRFDTHLPFPPASDAHLRVTVYEPAEHFTRHLATAQFRLSEWRADPR